MIFHNGSIRNDFEQKFHVQNLQTSHNRQLCVMHIWIYYSIVVIIESCRTSQDGFVVSPKLLKVVKLGKLGLQSSPRPNAITVESCETYLLKAVKLGELVLQTSPRPNAIVVNNCETQLLQILQNIAN